MAAHNLKVGMLILIQNDLEKAFEFYKSLGLTPKFHLKNRWAEFDLQGIKVGLCPTSEEELPERHTGIVLEVDNLRTCYNELKERGVTFVNEPKEAAHGIMVGLKDPGNNIIDLYQPTPEKVQKVVKQAVEKEESKQAACCQTEEAKKCC